MWYQKSSEESTNHWNTWRQIDWWKHYPNNEWGSAIPQQRHTGERRLWIWEKKLTLWAQTHDLNVTLQRHLGLGRKGEHQDRAMSPGRYTPTARLDRSLIFLSQGKIKTCLNLLHNIPNERKYDTMDLGVRIKFKSLLNYILPVWPWESCLYPPCPGSFF